MPNVTALIQYLSQIKSPDTVEVVLTEADVFVPTEFIALDYVLSEIENSEIENSGMED